MNKKMKNVFIITAIIIIGIGALLFIRQLRNREPQAAEEINLGVPVKTELVKEEDFEIIYNYSGTAEYTDKTKISSKAAGEIIEIYTAEGETVHKGQLLAKIDDKVVENNLKSARAALKDAEITLQKVKLAKEVAQNKLAESRAALKEAESDFEQWENDYQRDKKLFAENAIAEAKFEQTKTQYKKAEARLERMYSSLNSAERAVDIAELDIKSTEEKVEKSRSELKNLELKLADTEIRSPLDGKIIREFTENGEFAAVSQPLFEAAKSNSLEINVELGIKDLAELGIGSKAVISYSGTEKRKIVSEIREIGSTVDTMSRTTEIKIPIKNNNGELKDGMSVSVGIVAQSMDNALTIPNKAVFNFDSSPHVYLIREGRAVRRKIETGPSDGINTVVINSLNKGDKIAVSNLNELRDGIKVYLPQKENGVD